MTNRHERRKQMKAPQGNRAPATAIAERIGRAVALHQAGRIDQAEPLYREVLRLDPRQPDALYLLGVMALQRGDAGGGAALLDKAVAVAPDFAEAHASRGTALTRLGRHADAVEAYERSLAVRPDHPPTLGGLGVALAELGRFGEAEAAHRRAIALDPRTPAGHTNLGNALRAAGRLEEAAEAHRQAVLLAPGYAEGHNNLALVLQELGRADEAEAAFRRALELKPDLSTVWSNLGTLLCDRKRYDEAAEAHRRAIALAPRYAEAHHNLGLALQAQGDIVGAADSYRQAVTLDPRKATSPLSLGIGFRDPGEADAIIAALEQAAIAAPDNTDILCLLGTTLRGRGRLDQAEARFRQAIAADPSLAAPWSYLGELQLRRGEFNEGMASHRRAVELAPDHPAVLSNWLLALQYRPGIDARTLDREHRMWQERCGGAAMPDVANVRDPEKPLRIGFVSADFGRHPIGFFTLKLLENRAPGAFTAVGYSCDRWPDAVTERLQAAFDEWYEIRKTEDADLAERIREDTIDILFDMAGHTAHNRLPCFALKPAPIQISWAGYVGTTGLAAMDYLMADRFHVPPGEESHYRERVLRMPNGYICYAPPEDAPAVTPPPAAANGFVTFGSFNNPSKINDPLLEAWAEILRRVPDSRLFLKYVDLDDPIVNGRIVRRLAEHGIDASRLIFEGNSPHREHLAAYGRVDIGLDTSPYSGGLTTCEALWMGVPVVTMTGATFAGRHSTSHLSNVGLTETIAADAAGYVETAIALADDIDRLADLRAGLRARMAASPLCDGPRFARDFAAAMREVWRVRCTESASEAAS